jgi:hypothetical protein
MRDAGCGMREMAEHIKVTAESIQRLRKGHAKSGPSYSQMKVSHCNRGREAEKIAQFARI